MYIYDFLFLVPLSFHEQVNFSSISYDEIQEVYGGVVTKGLTRDALKKLPSLSVEESSAAQNTCCTICLQVIIPF